MSAIPSLSLPERPSGAAEDGGVWKAAREMAWDDVQRLISSTHDWTVDDKERGTGCTLLHVVASTGSAAGVNFLLEKGAQIDKFNTAGTTPLYAAASEGHRSVVELLVSCGASIDAFCDKAERVATLRSDLSATKSDVAARMSLNALLPMTRTPLHVACASGHVALVQFLLKHGADVHVRGLMGLSALHFAASSNSDGACSALIDVGADITVVDELGRFAFQVASETALASKLSRQAADAGAAIAGDIGLDDFGASREAADLPHDSHAASLELEAPDGLMESADSVSDDRPVRGKLSTDLSGLTEEADPATPPAEQLASEAELEACSDLMRQTFGAEILRRHLSKGWKLREDAITRARSLFITWSDAHPGGLSSTQLLSAGCTLLTAACNDKMQQVFQAVPAALRELLAKEVGLVSGLIKASVVERDEPISADDLLNELEESTPDVDESALDELVSALLGKAAESRERTSKLALSCLEFVACESAIGPYPVVSAIMRAAGIWRDGAAAQKGWRPIRAQLSVLHRIVRSFGFNADFAIRQADVWNIALSGVENASVKARQAGQDVAVAAALAMLAADGAKQDPQALVADISEQYFTKLKSNVAKRLESTLVAKLEGASGAATPAKGSDEPSKGKRRQAKTPKAAGAAGAEEAELPYSEPLSQEKLLAAAPCAGVFGEDVARCAFSHDWRARQAALKRMTSDIKEHAARFAKAVKKGRTTDADVAGLIQLCIGSDNVILAAVPDKVIHVCCGALKLTRRALKACDDALYKERDCGGGGALSAQSDTLKRCMLSWIKLAFDRAGDSNVKVRQAARSAVVVCSGMRSMGPRPLLAPVLESYVSTAESAKAITAWQLECLEDIVKDSSVSEAAAKSGHMDQNLRLADVFELAGGSLLDGNKKVREAATQVMTTTYSLASRGGCKDAFLSLVNGLSSDAQSRLQRALEATEAGSAAGGAVHQEAKRGGASPSKSTSGVSPSAFAPISAQVPKSHGGLSYSEPIPASDVGEAKPFVEAFGDKFARCLFSKTWSARLAAVHELSLAVADAVTPPEAEASAEITVSASSADVLLQVCAVAERGLQDTVTQVRRGSLTLLSAIVTHYLPTVSGRQLLVRPALLGCLRAVVAGTGHSQERVRNDHVAALLQLAAEGSGIGVAIVSEALLDAIRSTDHKVAGTMLVGYLAVLQHLVAEHGVAPDVGIRVDEVVSVLLPTFENRHLDVRKSASATFGTLFERVRSAGGESATNALSDHIKELRPALRVALAEAVSDAQWARDPEESPPSSDSRAVDATAPLVSSADASALEALLDADVILMLQQGDSQSRTEAVLAVAAAIPSTSPSRLDWEVLARLCKAVIAHPSPAVGVAAEPLFAAMAGVDGLIPWDSWEARLILSSLAKSVITSMSESRPRVASNAKRFASLFCAAHRQAVVMLARHVVSRVEVPKLPSHSSKRQLDARAASEMVPSALRLEVSRSVKDLLGRLRTVMILLSSPYGSEGSDVGLALDALLQLCGACLASSSALVRGHALDVAACLGKKASESRGQGIQAFRAFVATADSQVRALFQPILVALLSKERAGAGESSRGTVGAGAEGEGEAPFHGSSLSQFSFGGSSADDVLPAEAASGPVQSGRRAGSYRRGRGTADDGLDDAEGSKRLDELLFGGSGPSTAPTSGSKPFTPMTDVPAAPASAGGQFASPGRTGSVRFGRRAGSERPDDDSFPGTPTTSSVPAGTGNSFSTQLVPGEDSGLSASGRGLSPAPRYGRRAGR